MTIYVVQNKEGKYFRNVGYGGNGKSWRDKLEDAKFYTKLGQAESRVTFWFKKYPEYGCPRIIAFELGESNKKVIEMEDKTNIKLLKAARKELKRKKSLAEWKLKKGWEKHGDLNKEIAQLEAELKALQ